MEEKMIISGNKRFVTDYKYSNQELEEVVIEEGVIAIGERAFFECKNLRKIVLPQSLTIIGASAFAGCESLEEIVLPKNIKMIAYRTFADCKRLKKVIIPNGVEEIDWAVFSGCENLEDIILPNSVAKLGEQVFLNCKKLKAVSLPENLESLPDEFFKGCNSLEITLSPKIIKLGARVFENCYKLTTFPTNVTIFGEKCFKNCKSLETVNLNKDTDYLPKGMFAGCIRLEQILFDGDCLEIEDKCFQKCISLKEIPSFVTKYAPQAFENCTGLTSIDIIDSKIPFACFRNCKNIKTITSQEKISTLESFAFSGCSSLEEFDLYKVGRIPAEAFSHCKKLKTVRLNCGIREIGSRAFYNDESLINFNFPEALETIRKEAFKYCNSLREITIPRSLKEFGEQAFSYMDSLEKINVSPDNKNFTTEDNKILINQMQQKLVLYASGLKDESYSITDYVINVDIFNRSFIKPITGIGVYAFAGAKNLKELTICASVQDIEASAFIGCEKLKKLNVEAVSLYTCPGFRTRNHGFYYVEENAKVKADYPFETVEFLGDLVMIFPSALEYFSNVRKLIFPKDNNFQIANDAFKDCKLLESVEIPSNVTAIAENAFSKGTKLNFENDLEISNLWKLESSNEYIGEHKIYELTDERYYYEKEGKRTELTKAYIDSVCRNSDEIRNKPTLFIYFMKELAERDIMKRELLDGNLFTQLDDRGKNILFNQLTKENEGFFKILRNTCLLENYNEITKYILEEDHISSIFKFQNYLEKYKIKDQFLMNRLFIALCVNDKIESFFKYYDANLKRLLKASEIGNDPKSDVQNLKDLMNLLEITGAFQEDPIIRQRSKTFITEKIFAKTLPNGEKNKYRVVGDNIHRIYNFHMIREEFDQEFAEFFLENYQELMNREIKKSGFIERIYNNFREISKTNTSNKGSQRKLKVTMNKCISFLVNQKFDLVEKGDEKLAEVIGRWFDDNQIWLKAKTIYKESLKAPRNIFTKASVQEDGTVIYDNDPSNDLKEEKEGFAYEWLPKQDYDNLILGKYCNCCAHVAGAGSGIMRASMILDNCQNLVIRNDLDEIIAKASIYVNKSENYAVYNTVEISLKYSEEKDKKEIYEAFMRGTKAFLEAFNQNHPSTPIVTVTVGGARNQLEDYLTDQLHPKTEVKKSLHYGNYAIDYGTYSGDWQSTQRLVLRK